MIVALPDAKLHLRVDGDEEDAMIATFVTAAHEQVEGWLGRRIYASVGDLPAVDDVRWSVYQIVVTPAITVAVLMLVDRMYNHRSGEAAADGTDQIPAPIRALLAPLRVFA